ncbi:MAG: BMC domain-containing protein [Oligoflexia bacterium]|nr:BMC domain-containing protein [Oligoflexia bacterium]
MFNLPAVGILELKSIARGYVVADVMIKKSQVQLIKAHSICPGKFIVMVAGEVEEVKEAMESGRERAGDLLIANIYIPYVHEGIIPALTATTKNIKWDAVGIVESFSVADAFLAMDVALKKAAVQAADIRLANGLGGKAYFILTGELNDMEEAVGAAKELLLSEGNLVGFEIIANPHQEFLNTLF